LGALMPENKDEIAVYDGNHDTFQSFDESALFVWLTQS
jgi:hypothetical protein